MNRQLMGIDQYAEHDERAIFKHIVDGVREMGFNRVGLYVVSADRRTLIRVAHAGASEDFINQKRSVTNPLYGHPFSHRWKLHLGNQRAEKGSLEKTLIGDAAVWTSFPLALRNHFLGCIVADASSDDRLDHEKLRSLPAFASQATVAIANSNRLPSLEEQSPSFSELIKAEVGSESLNIDDVLSAPCKAAVEAFKVDHCGLVLYDSGQQIGRVISEHPPFGMRGLTVPLCGFQAEQRLADFKKPVLVHDISRLESFPPAREILLKHDLCCTLFVPVYHKGRLIGSLGLDMGESRAFTENELALCSVLAAQALTVLETAEIYRRTRQREEQLNILQSTALALTTFKDLNEVLNAITRQAVETLGARDGGIYQFIPDRQELTVISDYNFPNMIGTTLKVGEGLSGTIVKEDLAILSTSDYHRWPLRSSVFAGAERFGAVLGLSLKWQNRVLGVLYINDKVGRVFPSAVWQLPQPLNLLISTAAIAIDNAKLLQEADLASERIASSYDTSRASTSVPNSARLLQDITEQSLAAAGASWVRLVKFDENGNKENFLAACDSRPLDPVDHIRPDGISMQVLSSDEPYIIEDTEIEQRELNPALLASASRAAVCMPVGHGEKRLGVIWIHYDSPRRFLYADLEALTVYLNQASLAYDSARRMEELGPLRVAAEQIAAAVGTEEVLDRIANRALDILQADSVAVWHYQNGEPETELPLRTAVTAGVDDKLREALIGESISTGVISKRVLADGWFGIDNLDEPHADNLASSSRNILDRLEAKSLQGLALTAGDDKVGILYAINKKKRSYAEEEKKRARTFADHAAIALKAADQLNRAQLAAQQVAQLSVLGNLKETLKGVVDGTIAVLRCDAVTLFVYNETSQSLEPVTTMKGLKHPLADTHCQNARRESIVYRMLFEDTPRKVPFVAGDELFRDQDFVKREGIQSVCAIPLRFKEKRLGVMFVNYRRPHNFSALEDNTIALFGNQAAVAIRNARLFDDQNKQLKELETLVTLSEALLSARTLKETLKLAAEKTADSLGVEFVAIVLPDNDGKLRIKATKGWERTEVDDYNRKRKNQFQTDYTIGAGHPVFVPDYNATELPFEVPEVVKLRGIKSGLSVPVFSGNKKVGAVLVHSLSTRIFTEAEAHALSLIANLAASAIQQLKGLEDKIDLLEAVQRATSEISKIRLGISQKEVLDKLAGEAARCLPQAYLVTIELKDEPREMPLELAERKKQLVDFAARVLGPRAYLAPKLKVHRFESVHPPEMRDDLMKRMLEERASELDAEGVQERVSKLDAAGKRGIAKRAISTGEVQNAPNVFEDPDYLNLTDRTKSELAVPMVGDDGKAIGVINVESESFAAFDASAEKALGTLAKLAVTAIQNVEQYRQLKETLELVESSTLLAWFGMASSMWGHTIAGHAINISNNVTLLRDLLDENDVRGELRSQIESELTVVETMAEQIRETPTIALLGYDEGVSRVDINEVIRSRITQLWRNKRYKRTKQHLQLTPGKPRVRCNPDWIKRIIEILVDNAIDAMSESRNPELKVSTSIVEQGVELAIEDSGPGIPPDVEPKLFKERVEKAPGAKGLGIALLIVQAVARVYNGQAKVKKTGPQGTTMVVWLPLAKV